MSKTQNRKSDVQAKSWLKPKQIEKMRNTCLSENFPKYLQDRNESIIVLMYDTGLRVNEISSLNKEHLDLDEGTVYLPSGIQKGDVPPATLNLKKDTVRTTKRYLRDRWKDPKALFPSRSSDRITSRSIQRLIKKIAKKANVEPYLASGGRGNPEDVTPHTLRHSVAYRIIQVEGKRLEDVQLRLRHANRQTTDQIYSHLVPR